MARLVRRPNFRMRPPYSGISVLCLYAVKIKDRISFFFFRKCEHFQPDHTVRQKFRPHRGAPALRGPNHQHKTVSLFLNVFHIDKIILAVREQGPSLPQLGIIISVHTAPCSISFPGSAGNPAYPFTAPAITPSMMYFWQAK